MACRRIGNKTLSEPMLTKFADAYMRHYGEMSNSFRHTNVILVCESNAFPDQFINEKWINNYTSIASTKLMTLWWTKSVLHGSKLRAKAIRARSEAAEPVQRASRLALRLFPCLSDYTNLSNNWVKSVPCLPDCTKPLLEPMLTYYQWRLVTFSLTRQSRLICKSPNTIYFCVQILAYYF